MQILWCKNINELLIKLLHEMYFHKSSDSSFQSENLNQLILIFEVRFSEVYVLSKLTRRDLENVFSQFIQTWEVSHWNMFVRKKNVLVFLIFPNHIIICNSDKTNYGYMPRSLVAEYTLQNFIVFFLSATGFFSQTILTFHSSTGEYKNTNTKTKCLGTLVLKWEIKTYKYIIQFLFVQFS